MLSNKPFLFRSFTVSKITPIGGHIQLDMTSTSNDNLMMIVKKIPIKVGSQVDLLFSEHNDLSGSLYAIHKRVETDGIVEFHILGCSAQGHFLPSEQHMGKLRVSAEKLKSTNLRTGFTMCITPMWSVFDLIDDLPPKKAVVECTL